MDIALIPARAGSKRIARKNIRPIGGQPMIEWPIETAIQSKLFDRIVVSTDDKEIADIARRAGAETPFARPENLSDDITPLRNVIRHAIRELERTGQKVSSVCCIYATACFLVPKDLQVARSLLDEQGAHYAFAAASYSHPIQRAFSIGADNGVTPSNPNAMFERTQDLREHYYDAGMFFWGWRDAFFTDTKIYSPLGRIVKIPPKRAHDIDTPEDWAYAELVLEALKARRE